MWILTKNGAYNISGASSITKEKTRVVQNFYDFSDTILNCKDEKEALDFLEIIQEGIHLDSRILDFRSLGM